MGERNKNCRVRSRFPDNLRFGRQRKTPSKLACIQKYCFAHCEILLCIVTEFAVECDKIPFSCILTSPFRAVHRVLRSLMNKEGMINVY